MTLDGVHVLLTYQCPFECDHCFVWSSPSQPGTLSLAQLQAILDQAKDTGTVEWIYFEGGEPFLYYAILDWGVRRAAEMGFKVGIVSNAYWAVEVEDATEWLWNFAGYVQDLSISRDTYHGEEDQDRRVANALAAARALGIAAGEIRIAQPECVNVTGATGQLPSGESAVMYRGRAAARLASRAHGRPWGSFDACPHEDLREPGRVHVDPFGWVHLCQGLAMGNLFRTPLRALCASWRPESHPITGPLLNGGPAELARRYDVPHVATYADACHLCDATRRALRPRFPECLAPDQMYGPVGAG